jgi:sugar/nucleoside kinase (ribokinase family)
VTRVLCAGLVTVDLIHRVRRVPAGNEKLFDEGQALSVGGPAANAARTVAALGLEVRLVAAYGISPVTGFVREVLAGEGVEWIDPLAGSVNPTPLSSVLVDIETGDRAVIAGGTRSQAVPLASHEWLDGVDAVLLDGHGVGLPAPVAAGARARGIPVVLDGGSFKDGMTDCLPDVDLALLAGDFQAPGGADPITWARSGGARCAGVTRGGEPILLDPGTGLCDIPIDAGPVIDTLGAGDVVHGAAAAALAVAGGRPVPMRAVVAYAASVATASVRHPGALGWADDVGVRHRLRAALAEFAD